MVVGFLRTITNDEDRAESDDKFYIGFLELFELRHDVFIEKIIGFILVYGAWVAYAESRRMMN